MIWIARNSTGYLHLFLHKPIQRTMKIQEGNKDKEIICWTDPASPTQDPYPIDPCRFPDLKATDQPLQVELVADTWRQNLYKQAIALYGVEHQKSMVIEECAELINALAKERRNRKTDVITEIADVQIMLNQMKIVYGQQEVEAEIDSKLKRLENRMK